MFDAPKRLQAMLLSLQRYNLKLKYVKGAEMHIADLLSRDVESNSSDEERRFEVYELQDELDYFEEINSLEDIRVRDSQLENI